MKARERRRTMRALALGALLCAAGCAHSPEPVFFALSAHPGVAHGTRPLVIELRRPSLPAYLDRQHIVRRATAERLDLGDPRWAGPLDVLTSDTLAEDLAERLPNCFILTEGHGITAPADVYVELEISRFELDEHGRVDLDVVVAARKSAADSRPVFKHDRFTSSPAVADTAGVVTGMSDILAQLADSLAATVERM